MPDATSPVSSGSPACADDPPVFAEPWQAQAFSLTLALHERGVFTWSEWTQALSRAIAEAQAEGDADRGDTYYEHWLRALETLLVGKGIAQPLALASLRQAWRLAAESTPHGRPIRLNPAALRMSGIASSDT
jgi:nitrile hydratase accessory protein